MVGLVKNPPGITFDLWRTLIFEPENQVTSVKRMDLRADYAVEILASAGERVDRMAFKDAFATISAEMVAGHDNGTDVSFGRWVQRGLTRIDSELPGRLGISGIAAVGQAIDRAFFDAPPTVLEGSVEILESLRSRGLGVGLVTNTGLTSGTAFRNWFEGVGLSGIFHHIAYSNELGLAKPNRMMFDVTLRTLDARPERALHVGDNLHTDVGGAAAIGMSTVWVRGGVSSPVETKAKPDYTIDSVLELVPVVDHWLERLDG